jgi:hypothetical protein
MRNFRTAKGDMVDIRSENVTQGQTATTSTALNPFDDPNDSRNRS